MRNHFLLGIYFSIFALIILLESSPNSNCRNVKVCVFKKNFTVDLKNLDFQKVNISF